MAGRTPEEDRLAFQLDAIKKIDGNVLLDHIEQRANGEIAPHDLGDIIGDIPDSEVPGQIVLRKDELNPPSSRFKAIIDSIASHNLRVTKRQRKGFVIGAVGAGSAIVFIGTYFAVRHLLRKNDPSSDIADK